MTNLLSVSFPYFLERFARLSMEKKMRYWICLACGGVRKYQDDEILSHYKDFHHAGIGISKG